MRKLKVAFIFIFLSIMIGYSCSNGQGTSCTEDADCPDGNVCCKENGTTACKPKSECKAGGNCDLTCKSQADCFNYQTCKDGCCVERKAKKCAQDTDCPVGEECADSPDGKVCQLCAYPCKVITDCSKGFVCERNCCRRPPCKKNDDCSYDPVRPICDTNTGKCVECAKNEDCQANNPKSICSDNLCKKVECIKDDDCPAAKPNCNAKTYTCQKSKVCVTDSDCTDPNGIMLRCDPDANGGLGACKKGNCVPCNSDNECGGKGDFCIDQNKGLKDGPKCLQGCENNSDCPSGFICSSAIVPNFKVCFPTSGYCEDPCKTKNCPDGYRCEDGICKPDKPCLPCQQDSDCGAGNLCLDYNNGKNKFCGKKCKTAGDCPSESGRSYQCVQGQCVDTNNCQ